MKILVNNNKLNIQIKNTNGCTFKNKSQNLLKTKKFNALKNQKHQ